MPFRLTIKTWPPQTILPETEKEFGGSIIIGRSEASDVRLPDPKRLVSSRHAQIRQQLNQYLLIDVESTNGTTLNGQRLEAKKEYPLSLHDEIGIGEYVLEFLPIIQEIESTDPSMDADATICLGAAIPHMEKVVQRLRGRYRELQHRDQPERTAGILELLRESIQGLDQAESDQLLAYVEVTFPDSEFLQERILSEPYKKNAETSKSSASLPGIEKVAAQYLPSQSDSRSPEALALISERVEQVLAAFLEYLVDALQGRQQFEKELDVEVTRILGKERGPIKWAKSPQEIGAILFDMQRSNINSDHVVEELRKALADLSLHPMGLMVGFGECVRGFLKQLDPAILEAEAKASSSRLGALAVGPLLKSLAWDHFTKKHRMLAEEEVKTFQNLLGPEFAKGYLRVYQQTKSS